MARTKSKQTGSKGKGSNKRKKSDEDELETAEEDAPIVGEEADGSSSAVAAHGAASILGADATAAEDDGSEHVASPPLKKQKLESDEMMSEEQSYNGNAGAAAAAASRHHLRELLLQCLRRRDTALSYVLSISQIMENSQQQDRFDHQQAQGEMYTASQMLQSLWELLSMSPVPHELALTYLKQAIASRVIQPAVFLQFLGQFREGPWLLPPRPSGYADDTVDRERLVLWDECIEMLQIILQELRVEHFESINIDRLAAETRSNSTGQIFVKTLFRALSDINNVDASDSSSTLDLLGVVSTSSYVVDALMLLARFVRYGCAELLHPVSAVGAHAALQAAIRDKKLETLCINAADILKDLFSCERVMAYLVIESQTGAGRCQQLFNLLCDRFMALLSTEEKKPVVIKKEEDGDTILTTGSSASSRGLSKPFQQQLLSLLSTANETRRTIQQQFYFSDINSFFASEDHLQQGLDTPARLAVSFFVAEQLSLVGTLLDSRLEQSVEKLVQICRLNGLSRRSLVVELLRAGLVSIQQFQKQMLPQGSQTQGTDRYLTYVRHALALRKSLLFVRIPRLLVAMSQQDKEAMQHAVSEAYKLILANATLLELDDVDAKVDLKESLAQSLVSQGLLVKSDAENESTMNGASSIDAIIQSEADIEKYLTSDLPHQHSLLERIVEGMRSSTSTAIVQALLKEPRVLDFLALHGFLVDIVEISLRSLVSVASAAEHNHEELSLYFQLFVLVFYRYDLIRSETSISYLRKLVQELFGAEGSSSEQRNLFSWIEQMLNGEQPGGFADQAQKQDDDWKRLEQVCLKLMVASKNAAQASTDIDGQDKLRSEISPLFAMRSITIITKQSVKSVSEGKASFSLIAATLVKICRAFGPYAEIVMAAQLARSVQQLTGSIKDENLVSFVSEVSEFLHSSEKPAQQQYSVAGCMLFNMLRSRLTLAQSQPGLKQSNPQQASVLDLSRSSLQKLMLDAQGVLRMRVVNQDLQYPVEPDESVPLNTLMTYYFSRFLSASPTNFDAGNLAQLKCTPAEALVALQQLYRTQGAGQFLQALFNDIRKSIRGNDATNAIALAEIAGLLVSAVAGVSGVAHLLQTFVPDSFAKLQTGSSDQIATAQVLAHLVLAAISYSRVYKPAGESSQQQLQPVLDAQQRLCQFTQLLAAYVDVPTSKTIHPATLFTVAFVSAARNSIPQVISLPLVQQLRSSHLLLKLLRQTAKHELPSGQSNLRALLHNFRFFALSTLEGQELCIVYAAQQKQQA